MEEKVPGEIAVARTHRIWVLTVNATEKINVWRRGTAYLWLSQSWFSVLIMACWSGQPLTKPGIWSGNRILAVTMLPWAS